jgi:hypothetical protein
VDREPFRNVAPPIPEIGEAVDEDVGQVAGTVPLECVRIEAGGEREPP